MFSKDKCINTSRYIKLVSIFGFIIILSALTIITNSHSPNVYAFSIYNMYPWYFWALIVMAIFIGQMILIYNAISKYETNTWLIGFLMIIVSNLILLLMPIIRGYFIHGREDALTHIGYMVDIENTHSIGFNSYPMLHILGFTLKSFSGLSYNDITMFLPLLYSLFYIFSWYILGKYIFKNKRDLFIMLSFSSILLLGSKNVMLSPNGQAILFVPFFLYVFFKSRLPKKAVPYSILLILLSFFIIFSHPLVTILLTVTILLSDFTMYLNRNKNSEFKIKKSTNLLFIMICSFLIWSSYLHILAYSLENIISTLIFSDGGGSEFGRYQTSLSSVDVSFLKIFGLILNLYGPYIILSILSAACIIYMLTFWKKDNIEVNYYHKLSILGWAFLVIFSLLLFLFNDQFGFIRVYSYSIFFSIILISFSISMFLRRSSDKNNSNLKVLVIFSILILITSLSTYSLFLSPNILKIDQQTPESEFSAMKTFYKVKENYPVLERGTVNYRIYNVVYGVSAAKKNDVVYGNQVIKHFGYNNNSSLSDSYNKSYLLVSYVGRNQDQKLLPNFENRWNFNYSDFVHLDNDVGVTKFYSDKFSDIYIIKP
ncbi:hypothetical protein MSBRW_0969 [Methanosarcina barkeri str. Wiesmoor]|uniref:Glycosyltransferase RgtA/B/C/D-like domain-containing protein n=2 Tax=Methanosarcina barkeri TaxID=2208 RepID=A0A0E3QJJ7_METBA|nr:hypothetical protein [Methanosarcina barkeri]AKB50222.1 hypothetical protein MSBRW_0969 [Methanosarcina barkeri str. Wiesmoor]